MTGLHYMALFVAVPIGVLAGIGIWGALYRAAAVRRARRRAGERMRAAFKPPAGENSLNREPCGPIEEKALQLIHEAKLSRAAPSRAASRGGRLA